MNYLASLGIFMGQARRTQRYCNEITGFEMSLFSISNPIKMRNREIRVSIVIRKIILWFKKVLTNGQPCIFY